MDLNNNQTLSDWTKWMGVLKRGINLGEDIGMKDETIATIGSKVGNFLSLNVDPENREQRVLKEMWDVSNDTEKKAIAKIIMKMVQMH